jgi:hypothetical protein
MKMKLEEKGKQVTSNLFGTLFHPIAISNWLRYTVEGLPQEEELFLVEHEGEWRSLLGGKQLRAASKENLLTRMKVLVDESRTALEQSECLVLTLGTAHGWYYQGEHLVGNCQRLPQQAFQQKLTLLDEMQTHVSNTLATLKKHFPHLHIVVSVSPVKHWRLGVTQNVLGKSRLIELSHSLEATYFPGYDWVSEVLRDYRYFETDGCHPNSRAIESVSQFFLPQ